MMMMRWLVLLTLLVIAGWWLTLPSPGGVRQEVERALDAHLGSRGYSLSLAVTVDCSALERTTTDVGGAEPSVVVGSQVASEQRQPGNYDNQKQSLKYEHDQLFERQVWKEPRVTRIDCAVVVYSPLDPQARVEVEELVTAAAGLQIERGDRVVVVSSRQRPGFDWAGPAWMAVVGVLVTALSGRAGSLARR